MSDKVISMMDANGKYVSMKKETLIEFILQNTVLISGLSFNEIVDLQGAYNERAGRYPITRETLKEAFGL